VLWAWLEGARKRENVQTKMAIETFIGRMALGIRVEIHKENDKVPLYYDCDRIIAFNSSFFNEIAF